MGRHRSRPRRRPHKNDNPGVQHMSQSNTASLSLLARVPLWQQILVGLVLGVVVGMLSKSLALALAPVGALFLNAIKMLIVPLVFVSLVAGITAMSDSAKLGRISVNNLLRDKV